MIISASTKEKVFLRSNADDINVVRLFSRVKDGIKNFICVVQRSQGDMKILGHTKKCDRNRTSEAVYEGVCLGEGRGFL